jgi:hypothetical protein
VLGGLITANTFGLIGQRPWLGRDFQAADERPDADPVILSYALWQTQYGGDPDIVGRTITLSRRPFSWRQAGTRTFAAGPQLRKSPVTLPSLAEFGVISAVRSIC